MKRVLTLCRHQWDRASALGLIAGGLAAIVAGWIGVTGTILTFEQIPYLISGGLLGVCLVILGAALWISADLRDEWGQLGRLEGAIASSPRPAEVHLEDPAVSPADRGVVNVTARKSPMTAPEPLSARRSRI
jgi:hypothetical protein